ncbi:ABC transporter [Tistrella bauzanensis]|uniref:ABC transporter n=1 Tax=Tistrella bauzanensis TaxID=657419 RepID=A0ABQ1I9G0_9PROT|nr:ABC transporter ATP-binding protein [Tistrella bauzanensis]GGB26613.1 ABC transporter [Tistrella bauzanensis]
MVSPDRAPQMMASGIAADLGGRRVLDGIDLALEAGGLTALVGPNGAGKSTLLAILAGLLAPTAGRILIDGQSFQALGDRARARRIGYLEQQPACHWPLSVVALARLGRLPHRGRFGSTDPAADEAAVTAALASTALTGFRDRRVDHLSGGERMRAHLARVLAGAPQVVLADEPLAGLDPAHQLDVLGLLRDLAAAGRIVVVVMHDLALAARFADRVVLLAEGRVLTDGAPAQALDDAAIGRAYGVDVRRVVIDGCNVPLPWTRRPG